MDHQRRRQVAFLTQVLAGKGKMAETYMRNVHRQLVENMALNETHFGMVAGHLAATLEELGVETDVAADVMADVASLEDSVLNRDVMQVA